MVINLKGPCSLSEHYNYETKRWVYIFGDIHVKESKCDPENSTHIKNFLTNTLNSNPDKLIDIFIERIKNDKIGKVITDESSFDECYLTDSLTHFYPCGLHMKNDECKYKNLRLHNIDTEFRYLNSTRFSYLKNDFIKLLFLFTEINKNVNIYIEENNNQFYKGYEDEEYFKEVLEEINMLFNLIKKHKLFNTTEIEENFTQLLIDNVLENVKINKQLSSVEIAKIKNAIIDTFNKCIIESQKNLKDSYTDIKLLFNEKKLLEDSDIITIYDKLNIAYEYLHKPSLCIMDAYGMSRLFKKFKTENSKRSIDNHNAMYSIFYVGNLHALNYREFLYNLGYKTLLLTDNSNFESIDFQCLNISKFNQPFFLEHTDFSNEELFVN